MTDCPVCGLGSSNAASTCAGCGLATALFDTVREAAGPGTDAHQARAVAEMLTAIVAEGGEKPEIVMPPPRVKFFPKEAPVRAPVPLPKPPAVERDQPRSELHRQVKELTALAARLGAEDQGTAPRDAHTDGTLQELRTRRRNLFAAASSVLVEQYAWLSHRRDELATRVPTPAVDAELRAYRAALGRANLADAENRLRRVESEVARIESRWTNVQNLFTEVTLLGRILRARGGDPKGALGPVAQVLQASRRGDVARAERVLIGAKQVLWKMLRPKSERAGY